MGPHRCSVRPVLGMRLSKSISLLVTVNVDLQTEHGYTPRWCKRARVVTEQLIVAHCNVNLQDKDGRTTLHLTAIIGHAVVTKQLIDTHCNVNLLSKLPKFFRPIITFRTHRKHEPRVLVCLIKGYGRPAGNEERTLHYGHI
jgi:ankyrin repeat protein